MILIVIILIILSIYYYYRSPKHVGAVHSNKCHYFGTLQFSAQEFYTLVEQIMLSRQIPDVKMSRVNYNEAGMLSNKREYLRIERKEDIFDICAAPIGNGFFVSYWQGEPKHGTRDLAMKVPLLNTVVEGWQGTTYYQLDTASMFKLCVKDSITEAIEQVTTSKGIRGLSETERLAFSA
ncbi:hypothetical protein [Mucilaginibacter sp.]|uniref:hypothetical protein n=1 Tax=Mucilaginibacter sp. TaxID=1882438 RepID=UPI0025EB9AA3|nr:hypothetical protein [Mucilaginibacter sp.]